MTRKPVRGRGKSIDKNGTTQKDLIFTRLKETHMTDEQKPEETPQEEQLKLDITGRGTLLLELTNSGPITFDIDDPDIIAQLLRVLLDNFDEGMPIHGYDKEEEATLTGVLKRPIKPAEEPNA